MWTRWKNWKCFNIQNLSLSLSLSALNDPHNPIQSSLPTYTFAHTHTSLCTCAQSSRIYASQKINLTHTQQQQIFVDLPHRAYTHTYINIHTHTYTHYINYTHIFRRIHIVYACIFTHIHIHTCTHKYAYSHTYTYTHIHTYTYTYTHIYTDIHIYSHRIYDTRIHTHTYTYHKHSIRLIWKKIQSRANRSLRSNRDLSPPSPSTHKTTRRIRSDIEEYAERYTRQEHGASCCYWRTSALSIHSPRWNYVRRKIRVDTSRVMWGVSHGIWRVIRIMFHDVKSLDTYTHIYIYIQIPVLTTFSGIQPLAVPQQSAFSKTGLNPQMYAFLFSFTCHNKN
jgi:hypothetical protein